MRHLQIINRMLPSSLLRLRATQAAPIYPVKISMNTNVLP